MAGYLRWLAGHPERRHEVRGRVDTLRQELALTTAHRRTPTLVADVALGWRTVLDYATDCGALSERDAEASWRRVLGALVLAAQQQDLQHAEADPAQRFLELISTALSSGRAHLSAFDGGPPDQAQAWGWRTEMSSPALRAHGRRLGFVDGDSTFIFPDLAREVVCATGGSGEEIALTRMAMGKRLYEGGFLLSGELGVRNTLTVRKHVKGKRLVVWNIPARHLGIGL
jgi:hypothetical protein